jgi:hypothetical protein
VEQNHDEDWTVEWHDMDKKDRTGHPKNHFRIVCGQEPKVNS